MHQTNIHLIVFQSHAQMYIGYHSNPTRLCVLITQIHSQMKAKMWLSSLQSLAFTRGLSAYKYETSKIRKYKRKIRKRK